MFLDNKEVIETKWLSNHWKGIVHVFLVPHDAHGQQIIKAVSHHSYCKPNAPLIYWKKVEKREPLIIKQEHSARNIMRCKDEILCAGCAKWDAHVADTPPLFIEITATSLSHQDCKGRQRGRRSSWWLSRWKHMIPYCRCRIRRDGWKDRQHSSCHACLAVQD